MAVFGAIFFSTVRIRESCVDCISRMAGDEKTSKKIGKLTTLFRIMLFALPVVGLVGASNLSTAVIILGIAVILIFTASPKYAQFIWMAVTGIGFMAIFLGLERLPFGAYRHLAESEKYEKGYQTLQGLFAIGSGGLFGKGLGSSIQKLGFVPEAQNDMIFSHHL